MPIDPSNGWDAVADKFVAIRSAYGVDVVRRWAGTLPRGASVLDVGAGSGMPLTKALLEAGLDVSAIDASPRLVAAFRTQFPGVQVACEPAEASTFFGRTHDGAIAVGLIFLLPASDQSLVIRRIAQALRPGGRFLFSAPRQSCEWEDTLTGRRSVSLGTEVYGRILREAGMELAGNYEDEGQTHYFDAVKQGDN